MAIGGWRLVAIGGWQRLVVGGWWRLAVGGGWPLAVAGPCGLSLRAVILKGSGQLCEWYERWVLARRDRGSNPTTTPGEMAHHLGQRHWAGPAGLRGLAAYFRRQRLPNCRGEGGTVFRNSAGGRGGRGTVEWGVASTPLVGEDCFTCSRGRW